MSTHGDSPIDVALKSIPDWVEARDRLRNLRTYTPQFRSADDEIEVLVVSVLEAGQALNAEVEAEAARIQAATAGPALVGAAYEKYRARLESEFKNIAKSHPGPILFSLHEQLLVVLDEGTALAKDLNGVRDAEAAIAAGCGDALVEFRALADRYCAIRHAQYAYTATVDSLGRKLSTLRSTWVFNIADPFAADPLTLARRTNLPVETAESITPLAQCAPEPWPRAAPSDEPPSQTSEDRRLSLPVFDWETAEAFDWLIARPETHPWVPNLAELAEIMTRLELLERDVRQEQARREAKKRTYRVRPTGPLSERLTKGLI